MGTRFITRLGKMGMPRMMYGTAWKKEKTALLVEKSLAHGFRGIDTAGQRAHYNQLGTGEGIQKWLQSTKTDREALFIQTKYSPYQSKQDQPPYNPDHSLYKQVIESAENSLEELHVDYIDSFLLHSPLQTMEDIMEVWSAFEDLVHHKKVKYIGISNFYQPHVVKMVYNEAKIKPSVIQNRFYADTNYDKEIRAFCDNNDIVYQSFWSLTANGHIIQALGEQQEAVHKFYRYLMGINVVPLNGTTSEKHMKEDVELLNQPVLDQHTRTIIESLMDNSE